MTRSSRFRGNVPKIRRRNNKDKAMIFALAGLAFSFFLVFVVVLSFPSANAKTAVIEEPTIPSAASVGTVTLYAASKYVKRGSNLSGLEFREIYWPRNAVPDGVIRDPEELNGKFAKVDIADNQPILRSHITSEKVRDSLPISAGMRAVTIAVDSKSGLEGWATPGSRVDVTLTYVAGGEMTSKIIVQNAKVLSYAGNASLEDNKGTSKVINRYKRRLGNTITLEMIPADALKVQTSRELGNLSLLMRSDEDSAATLITEVDKNDIDGKKKSRTIAPTKRSCNKGVMRMEGKDYLINCDGSIDQLAE